MAYLTKSSFNKLVRKVSISAFIKSKEDFVSQIYDDGELYYFFNRLDLSELLKRKLLLSSENHNESSIKVFQTVKIKIDNKKYIFFKGGKPKYHLYKNCSSLDKDFKDFLIPDEIRKAELIDELRNWFNQNNFTADTQQDLLVFRFNSYFPIKYKEKGIKPIQGFLIEENKNSGKTYVADYFDNLNFKQELDVLKSQRKRIYGVALNIDKIPSSILNVISKFDYLSQKNETDEIVQKLTEVLGRDFTDFINEYPDDTFENGFFKPKGINRIILYLKKHYEIKHKAYRLLSDFLMWNYGLLDKQFNEVFLEDFNFECCKFCKEKRDRISIEELFS